MEQFHFLARPCRNGALGWIAMCKREPFVTDGQPIHEPGELWFKFGDTEAEAMGKLEAHMRDYVLTLPVHLDSADHRQLTPRQRGLSRI